MATDYSFRESTTSRGTSCLLRDSARSNFTCGENVGKQRPCLPSRIKKKVQLSTSHPDWRNQALSLIDNGGLQLQVLQLYPDRMHPRLFANDVANIYFRQWVRHPVEAFHCSNHK